jgi:hypothetical protein
MPNTNTESLAEDSRLLARSSAPGPSRYTVDPRQDIRFSLLDKKFNLSLDTLVSNVKNTHTIKANEFVSFTARDKEYLIVAQQFTKGPGAY